MAVERAQANIQYDLAGHSEASSFFRTPPRAAYAARFY
jgi:hypothetical protein